MSWFRRVAAPSFDGLTTASQAQALALKNWKYETAPVKPRWVGPSTREEAKTALRDWYSTHVTAESEMLTGVCRSDINELDRPLIEKRFRQLESLIGAFRERAKSIAQPELEDLTFALTSFHSDRILQAITVDIDRAARRVGKAAQLTHFEDATVRVNSANKSDAWLLFDLYDTTDRLSRGLAESRARRHQDDFKIVSQIEHAGTANNSDLEKLDRIAYRIDQELIRLDLTADVNATVFPIDWPAIYGFTDREQTRWQRRMCRMTRLGEAERERRASDQVFARKLAGFYRTELQSFGEMVATLLAKERACNPDIDLPDDDIDIDEYEITGPIQLPRALRPDLSSQPEL